MSSMEQQQQQPKRQYNVERPTLHFGAAESNLEGGMPNSSTALSPATTPVSGGSPGFLTEMPQWKKDLIQRRKTNVARTMGATSPSTATANAALTLSAALTEGSCGATLNETTDLNVTEADAATKVLATTTSQEQQQLQLQSQQKHLKRNVNQTTFKTSPTEEEKSEKCFIGGHHTLPAAPPAAAAQSVQGKDITEEEEAAAAATKTTTITPIPKQRSSLFNNNTQANTTRSQSTSKEPENLNLDAREQQQSCSTSKLNNKQQQQQQQLSAGEESDVVAVVEFEAGTGMVNSRSFCGEVETGTAAVTTATTIQTTTGALTAISAAAGSGANVKQTAAAAATSSSSAIHLQTKCKVGQSGDEAAAATLPLNKKEIQQNITATNILPLTEKNCKTKISDKLQNNKFIKNQQQQQQQLELAVAVSSNNSKIQPPVSPTKVAVKQKMVALEEIKKTKQNGHHGHNHHHHNHTAAAHHQIHQNHQHHQHQQLKNAIVTTTEQTENGALPELVDTGEDLSYGPGIVSKLRCRYLSLALRESSQQQLKQQLRRSTSLNTLLDRNDDEEDLHSSGEVVIPQQQQQQQQQELQQQMPATQRHVPPPIGLKPTVFTKSPHAHAQRQLSNTSNGVQLRNTMDNNQPQQQQQINGLGATRSRHFKRGNEVMKRARSVEALLCEKSPWNTQRSSYTPPSITSPSSANVTVTIEDKIHNARERLHSGTDTAPPKRLTSIIDDTERPPPDLVKQTLKMFEASANRRPRAAQRNNGVGGVASKVASYKSIIKEQKSAISYAKPTTPKSPTPLTVPGFDLGANFASTPKQGRGSGLDSNQLDILPKLADPSTHDAASPITMLCHMYDNMQLDNDPMGQQHAAFCQTEARNLAVLVGGSGGSSHRLVSSSNSSSNSSSSNNKHEGSPPNDEDETAAHDDQQQQQQYHTNDDAEADANNDGDNNNTNGAGDNDDVDDDNNDGGSGDNMGAAGISKNTADDDKAPPEATLLAAETCVETEANAAVAATTINAAASNSTTTSTPGTAFQRPTIGNILASSGSGGIQTKQIAALRPLTTTGGSGQSVGVCTLTSREIEKNRINEMKKSTALAADAATPVHHHHSAGTITSLDTVINTKSVGGNMAGLDNSETDAASSTTASPIWALRKRRQGATGSAGMASGSSAIGVGVNNSDNTTMVFNFSKSTKEVPDYIESDVVIYRRKRELPKPNEPGFVLLGDLTVETSTDSDYDDYSMCPPSPCDVEFENANIVIDGKSSIRQKPKESSFRVQFNDTLTSIFEYPSESSPIVDDPPYADPYGNVRNQQLLLDEQHRQQHHHVTVDEIIELPTSTAAHKTPATSNILGNLPLDYPSLGKGIILQQPPQQRKQQPTIELELTLSLPPNNLAKPMTIAMECKRQLVATAATTTPPVLQILGQQPPVLPRRRRAASVLRKPQYACFLQNDTEQRRFTTPQIRSASFSTQQQSQQQQPPSKYKLPSNNSIAYSGRRSSLPAGPETTAAATNMARLTKTPSLKLPRASTALLQARIPGNTLYYV